jgi:NAD(P)-dependent dehydrogenase (short-subunit alcohol dehydrogenase family)
MTGTPTSKPDRSGDDGTIDRTHLLLVGAGPGLGVAVARRFAVGGYRVTLVARSKDKLADLVNSLSDTGAEVATIEADASDPEGLGADWPFSTAGNVRRESSSTTRSWVRRINC